MKICRFNNFLSEDHAQLELPFDHSKRGYGRKPLHIDFLDALSKLGVKAPSYSSKATWDENLKRVWPDCIEEVLLRIDDATSSVQIFTAWLEDLNRKERLTKDIFSKDMQEDHKVDHRGGYVESDDLYSIIDTIPDLGLDGLSEKGKKLLAEDLPEVINQILGDNGPIPSKHGALDTMEDSYKQDPDGLINCWRSMIIDNTRKDIYKEVTAKYKGVGRFWSWSEDGATPHNGYNSVDSKIEVVLCGKVRLEDIDWPRTIWVNVWDLREEMEITLKDDALVKIESVMITGNRHYVGDKNLDSKVESNRQLSIIIPAGKGH